MNTKALFCGSVVAASAQACSFNARKPEDYRQVTQELLATRADQLRTCYDAALAANASTGGIVVVSFKVEGDTGKLLSPTVDAARTTAPEVLQKCVTAALDGLAIDPPDAREGSATFSWEFKPGSTTVAAAPAPAPTPAPAPAQ